MSKFWERKHPLIGSESELLANPVDLVALKPEIEQDRLSKFLRDYCWYFFTVKVGTPNETHIYPPYLVGR